MKQQMAFKQNDRVQWYSQAGGIGALKVGKIIAVLPAGTLPKVQLDHRPGGPRKHKSYVVWVPGKTAKAQGMHYWPVARKLVASSAGQSLGRF